MSERDERIAELLPLVRTLAKRVARMLGKSETDDLVGDGHVGLVRAVDAYDPSRGIALRVYASRMIVGAMLNGARRMDPVSERARRLVRDAERMRDDAALRTGVYPSFAQLEAADERLKRARQQLEEAVPLSLDTTLPIGERECVDWSHDPGRLAIVAEATRMLQSAIDALPPRERTLVHLHYETSASLQHVSEVLAISRQRASQLHLRALRRLRATAPPPALFRT